MQKLGLPIARTHGCLLLGLVCLGLLWSMVYLYCGGTPVADEWDLARTLINLHDNGLSYTELFSFHNEHRILVPRLYFYIMAELTGWDIRLVAFANMLLPVFTGMLMAWFVSKQLRSRWTLGMAWLAIVCVVTSWSQSQNFLWSFQFPWLLIPLLLVINGVLLVHRGDSVSLFLSSICSVIAAGCMAHGLVVYMVTLLWVVLLSTSWRMLLRRLSIMAAVAPICGWLAIRLDSTPNQSRALFSGGSMPVAEWFFNLLGQPLLGRLNVTEQGGGLPQYVVTSAGFALFVSVVVIVLHAIRRGQWREPMMVFSFGLIAYGLVCAFLVTLGRCGYGLMMASQGRYITNTNYVVLGALIAFLSILDARSVIQGRVRTLTLGLSLVCLLPIAAGLSPIWASRAWYRDLKLVYDYQKALLMHKDTPVAREQLKPILGRDLDSTFRIYDTLVACGFSRPSGQPSVGFPSSRFVSNMDPSLCLGSVERNKLKEGVLSLSGWAYLMQSERAPDLVVLIEQQLNVLRVVSVCSQGRRHRPDAHASLPHLENLNIGWQMDVPVSRNDSQYFVAAYDAHKNLYFLIGRL